MAAPSFEFQEFSQDKSVALGLDPTPFPARSGKAKGIFGKPPVDLQKVLEELEFYVKHHPGSLEVYSHNIETLSMICATNQINEGDAAGALMSLGYGLRANPQNNSLRVHQALALQINGYNEMAAYEYEALLYIEPYAYDPIVRTLAAKAFAAIGQYEDGVRILEGLAEDAFEDEDLQALRLFLLEKAVENLPDAETPDLQDIESDQPELESKSNGIEVAGLNCKSCDTKNEPDSKFCRNCGGKLAAEKVKKFCTQCGAEMQTSKKFCTRCGNTL